MCQPPLRCLSQTEKSGEKVCQFISRVLESLPLIYEGGGCSTFYGKWVIGLRNGKVGRLIFSSGPVLPLDNQVIPNLLLQESFDHPKGGYVCDSWEDVFSICEGSAGKLLVVHLLGDGSWLGDDVSGQ